MLTVVTYWWGNKYSQSYVDKLFAAVARNLTIPHRRVLATNMGKLLRDGDLYETTRIPEQDRDLLYVPGCFARLRLFDAGFQEQAGILPGDRVLSLDLDVVVAGNLDAAASAPADGGLRILQDVNSTNPCPYNGSVWSFDAGTRQDAWSDFSLENYKRLGIPHHAFPDDQGWLRHKFPEASKFGADLGVYAFKKRGWPLGDALPPDARLVCFPGWRDPSRFRHLSWVARNWR